MSFWLLEFLLMKNSWDRKPPTSDKKTHKTQKTKRKIVCTEFTCFLHMQVNIIWTQSLVCTLNVSCLNTIINLYSERLTFKHHCRRLCFAAAREGHFPQVFSYISLNRKTPLPSIILTVSLWYNHKKQSTSNNHLILIYLLSNNLNKNNNTNSNSSYRRL